MGEPQVRSENTAGTSIRVLLLMCLFVAGNTSGSFVLCVGDDGHVAFEPVFHDRCVDPSHTRQEGTPRLAREVSSHIESPHCKPCVDIPISMGLSDDQLPPNQVTLNSLTLATSSRSWAVPDSTFTSVAAPYGWHAAAEFALLRTVILLV